MKRIAISGKMASGKTSISDYLIDTYGYKRYSIAEQVKAFANAFALHNTFQNIQSSQKLAWNEMTHILSLLAPDKSIEEIETLLKHILDVVLLDYREVTNTFNKTDKVRGLLQTIGNKFRDIIFLDVWVSECINRLDNGLCVIDDLRYKNEFNALSAAGFKIIRLDVSPEIQRERLNFLYGHIPQGKIEHISEIDLDNMPFDYVIDSSNDLDYVKLRIDEILGRINL